MFGTANNPAFLLTNGQIRMSLALLKAQEDNTYRLCRCRGARLCPIRAKDGFLKTAFVYHVNFSLRHESIST